VRFSFLKSHANPCGAALRRPGLAKARPGAPSRKLFCWFRMCSPRLQSDVRPPSPGAKSSPPTSGLGVYSNGRNTSPRSPPRGGIKGRLEDSLRRRESARTTGAGGLRERPPTYAWRPTDAGRVLDESGGGRASRRPSNPCGSPASCVALWSLPSVLRIENRTLRRWDVGR